MSCSNNYEFAVTSVFTLQHFKYMTTNECIRTTEHGYTGYIYDFVKVRYLHILSGSSVSNSSHLFLQFQQLFLNNAKLLRYHVLMIFYKEIDCELL